MSRACMQGQTLALCFALAALGKGVDAPHTRTCRLLILHSVRGTTHTTVQQQQLQNTPAQQALVQEWGLGQGLPSVTTRDVMQQTSNKEDTPQSPPPLLLPLAHALQQREGGVAGVWAARGSSRGACPCPQAFADARASAAYVWTRSVPALQAPCALPAAASVDTNKFRTQ